jgi:hypothetical protein
MMGGGRGREIPIFIPTSALVTVGKKLTNAKKNVPKSNFFILLPPLRFSENV